MNMMLQKSSIYCDIRRVLLCLLIGTCVFSISTALADWSYQVTNQVAPGKKGKLTLQPPEKLKNVTVTLTSGSIEMVKKYRVMRAGKSYKISFKPPKGSSEWSAALIGSNSDGQMSINFEFTVVSSVPIKVDILTNQSDLTKGVLYFKSKNRLN